MASTKKHTPTILNARLSFSSRRCTSASTDILQSNTEPEVTSIKLSTPKPTNEMLPAITPIKTASKPSIAFHVMVKYSSLRPRCTRAARSSATVSVTGVVLSRFRTRLCIQTRSPSYGGFLCDHRAWLLASPRSRQTSALVHRAPPQADKRPRFSLRTEQDLRCPPSCQI